MTRLAIHFRRFRKLLIPLALFGCIYFLTRRSGDTSTQDDILLQSPDSADSNAQPVQDVPSPQRSGLNDDDEEEEDIEDDYYLALRPSRLRNRPGVPVPPLDQAEALRDNDLFPKHTYHSNGLLEVNPHGRHPIYDLIERAEKEWDEKIRRQSTTLEDAVLEYKRRYARLPPPGFDHWYALPFCRAPGVYTTVLVGGNTRLITTFTLSMSTTR